MNLKFVLYSYSTLNKTFTNAGLNLTIHSLYMPPREVYFLLPAGT